MADEIIPCARVCGLKELHSSDWSVEKTHNVMVARLVLSDAAEECNANLLECIACTEPGI